MKLYCACGCDDFIAVPEGDESPVVLNAKKKSTLSPLRADPTRTTTLRKKFLAEVNRRFKEIINDIWELIVIEDALGLETATVPFVRNAERQRWRFVTDDRKVANFREWLQTRIDSKLLSLDAGESVWTAKYVESAYKQGIVRAWVDKHRRDHNLQEHPLGYEKSKADFLRTAFGAPEAVSKLKLLQTRTFEALRGVTQGMATSMTRVLTDGLAYGYGVERIAQQLEDHASLPIARARTVARTEIMHAHAEGQLDSFEELGVEEIGVMAEWSTAGDDRVCPVCQPLEGLILTVKEARGMIPRHPNCRCTWIPANVGEDEKGQKRTRSRIASAIKRSLMRETEADTEEEAKEKSRWVGADRTIAGKKKQLPLISE